MIRDYTTGQYNNTQLLDARDITLVRWEHSGVEERLSCNGRIVFDGEVYTEGGLFQPVINDQREATITLPVSSTRLAEVENGTWREGICQIYKIPAVPGDVTTFALEEAYLQINGVIDSSQAANGLITVQVLQIDIAGSLTPRITANQMFSQVLTAGSIIVNDGVTMVLETVRQDEKSFDRQTQIRRGIRAPLSARQINSFREGATEFKLNGSASGAHLPVVFGRKNIPGWIIRTWPDGADAIFLVCWGQGEFYEFEQIFINDAVPTSGIELRNYRGHLCQAVDTWITDVDGTFTDTGIYTDAAGQIGAPMSVVKIPATELGAEPFFQAIVKGCLVFDPDSTSDGDPYYADVGLSVHFTGTNGQTSATDDSTNAHTITFNGDAQIQGNELELDGTGDSVTIADHASLRPGTGSWTWEGRFTPDTISGAHTLFERYGGSSARSMRLRQIDDDLAAYLSTDGTTSDIAGNVIANNVFTANTETDVKLEFDAMTGTYMIWVDGDEVWRTTSGKDPLNENGEDVVVGDGFDGTIRCIKFTQGHIRYGGCHTVTASPFSDSATYQAGYVYSDNGALVQAEIARNAMFGAGATVYGLDDCEDWADEDIGGGQKRSQVSLRLAQPRRTEEYLDMLTEYSWCFWFPDGDGIRMIPDKPVGPDNPSGQELVLNPVFDTTANWVLGSSCSINTSLEVMAWSGLQTSNSISYTLLAGLEPGVPVAIKLDVSLVIAGSVRLDVNLVEVISAQSSAGTVTVEYVPSTETLLIQVIADADFFGWVNIVSVRRYYWLSENSVGNSLGVYGLSNRDTPTRVEVIHTTPDTDSANWVDAEPVADQLPAVASSDLPLRPTTVYMPGLYSQALAQNYATARLYRTWNRTRVTWRERDFALLFQKGTVVHKRDTQSGSDGRYRILNTRCVDQGRYEVTGLRYDESHWPSEQAVSVSGLTFPVGMILPLNDTVAPSGNWSIVSAADGTFPRMTTVNAEIGTTGGSATHAGVSDTTETGGGHGPGFGPFPLSGLLETGGAISGDIIAVDETEKGAHGHTYDTGTLTPSPLRREMRLVKRTTSAATTLPAATMPFGQGGLNIPNLARSTVYQGRLFKAASALANAGSSTQSVELTTDTADDTHEHITRTPVTDAASNGGFSPDHYNGSLEGGGVHDHDATLTLKVQAQRLLLAMYAASADYELDQGLFAFWDDDLSNMQDPNWTLCDGTLGTPDSHERVIEIAKQGQEDTSAGDDTLRLYGTTDPSALHSHEDDFDTGNGGELIYPEHSLDWGHNHSIDETVAYILNHTKWAMFMLNPNPVVGFIDRALLISGGEADGATTIVDDSSFNLSPDTVSGSPEYDDAQQMFSLNSILNTSGDRLYYSSFNYGRKFTFEGFFRLGSSTSGSLAGNGSGTEDWEVRYNAGVGLEFLVDGVVKDTTSDPGAGAWFFIAVAYDAAEWRFYYGLVSVGTAALQHTETDVVLAHDEDLYIGNNAAGSSAFEGHYAQIRVTRGADIHQGSAISIPIAAFPTS